MKRMHSLLFSLILPVLAGSSLAQPLGNHNNPQLSLDGVYTLKIPLADSAATPGLYQDTQIVYSPQDKSWRLVGYNTGVLLHERNIEKVELLTTTEHPVQVFLKVSGIYPMMCGSGARISQRRSGNTFEVSLFDNHTLPYPPPPPELWTLCLASVAPFTHVIPLPVYSLKAGSYRYVLNGTLEGSFTLARDNALDIEPYRLPTSTVTVRPQAVP